MLRKPFDQLYEPSSFILGESFILVNSDRFSKGGKGSRAISREA